MSKGDENLDQLVKDAFDAEQHEFVPAYWQEAQQMLQANKVAQTAFYAKPVFLVSSAILLIAALGLYSDSVNMEQAIAQGNSIQTSSTEITSTQIVLSQENTPNQIIRETKNQTDVSELSSNNTKTKNVEVIDFEPKNETSKNFSTLKNLESSASTKPLNTTITAAVPKTDSRVKVKANSTSNAKADGEAKNMDNTKAEGETNVAVNTKAIGVGNATAEVQENTPVLPAVLPDNSNSSVVNVDLPKSDFSGVKNPAAMHDFEELKTSRVNANATQLEFMKTNKMFLLDEDFENASLLGTSNSKHKKINHPLNFRVSAGTLWGKPLHTESPLIQNTYNQNAIEISLEYMVKKNWGVQVGAGYTQSHVQQERNFLAYEDNSYWEEEQVVNEVINRVWWLGGWYNYPNTYDTSITHVHVKQVDTVSSQQQINHKIQMVEIPVLITYNYGINRFNIQLSTGVSFGTIIGAFGSNYVSNDPYAMEISSSANFKSLQTNFLFRTELAYGLNDNWWVSAQPQLKWNLNSIYPDGSTTKPRLMYYGVNVGLIYRF